MVGGMEQLSYALSLEFPKHEPTTLLTWGKSQKYLPFVVLYFFVRSLLLIPKKKITHIHIGDGLLSPLGLLLKIIFKIKVTSTIVGLDVTFNFPGYQLLIPACLKRLDKIICISSAVRDECIARGIPEENCIVIPCGVYSTDWITHATRRDLETTIYKDIGNKKVIITVGRLVKRKGIAWFVQYIMPKLENTLYLIIGEGPEKGKIKKILKKLHLQEKVMLLGKISDEELKIIYNTADVFVMPNIPVSHTMEGFGIVAIEASSTGLPVVASNIEGISSAVLDGKTGYLVESMNAEEFIHGIKKAQILDKKEIADATRQHYSWQEIGKEYIKNFE